MKTPTRIIKIPFRYAVFFDGVDDSVIGSFPSSIANQLQNEMTILIWFYADCGERGFPRLELFQYNYRPDMFIDYRLKFHFIDENGVSRDFYHPAVTPDLFGKWHFAAAAYKAYSFVRLTVDDATVTLTNNYRIQTPVGGWGIQSIGGWPPYGLRNELCVYSRALTADEISWNYNNPSNPVKDGLVLWLQADPQNIKDRCI